MEIQKGKTCLRCNRVCGNATRKCPPPCGFDFTTSKEEVDDHMETEDDETTSESGSENGDQDSEPCEDSSAEEESWSSGTDNSEEDLKLIYMMHLEVEFLLNLEVKNGGLLCFMVA